MPITAAEAARAEWGDRRGDRWHRRWTRTESDSTLTELIIEIRRGRDETAELVASSVEDRQGDAVAAIDISGTDLAADPAVIDWVIEPAETLKLDASPADRLAPGHYVLEFEVLRDGHPDTILRHSWRVDPQVAVRPEEVAP